MLKKMNLTTVLVFVGVVVLVGYFVMNGMNKQKSSDSMSNYQPASVSNIPDHILNPTESAGVSQHVGSDSCCGPTGGKPQPYSTLGPAGDYANVNGVQTSSHGLPKSCMQQEIVDPKELLPKDDNSEWAKLNPIGTGDLQNVNLIKAGYHIGINTVGQSLRNANLQLRSEPANPQMNVGPWNNTTIEPDINRRPLEIGCGPL